jgi:hypothetical protein
MQTVTIFATMRPESDEELWVVIVEHTSDFGQFVALVLGFRRDPDCVRLVWHVETPAPAAAGRPMLTVPSAC